MRILSRVFNSRSRPCREPAAHQQTSPRERSLGNIGRRRWSTRSSRPPFAFWSNVGMRERPRLPSRRRRGSVSILSTNTSRRAGIFDERSGARGEGARRPGAGLRAARRWAACRRAARPRAHGGDEARGYRGGPSDSGDGRQAALCESSKRTIRGRLAARATSRLGGSRIGIAGIRDLSNAPHTPDDSVLTLFLLQVFRDLLVYLCVL